MKAKALCSLAVASLTLLSLTACATTTQDAPEKTPEMSSAAPSAAEASLTTETSALGAIVVDGDHHVVYQFDKDVKGAAASSCEGECAVKWPAVPGDEGVDLDGITGTVGTITGVDGKPQLTLDGWPLYYYAGDEAPGDLKGQGVGNVWWALTPAGEPIRN